MMLIALIGGTSDHQEQITDEIKNAASSLFNVKCYRSEESTPTQKFKRLNDFMLHRPAGGILTIISGTETPAEFCILRSYHTQICILPGTLSPIFTRFAQPILDRDLFVTARPEILSRENYAKRNLYKTPEEVYSITYANYRGFAEVSA